MKPTTRPTEKGIADDYRGYDDLDAATQRRLDERAREAIETANYFGCDAEGALHYYNWIYQRAAVFESPEADPQVFELEELPIPATPRKWAEHVYHQRGSWTECFLERPGDLVR